MTLHDDIAELEEQLDPVARAVFSLLRKTNEELTESNKQLTESNKKLTEEVSRLTGQVAKFQKMLFGPKSEKLPPIESEVRRVVEAEELMGNDDSSNTQKLKLSQKKRRPHAVGNRVGPKANPNARRTERCEKICR